MSNFEKYVLFPLKAGGCRPHLIGGAFPTDTGVKVVSGGGDTLAEFRCPKAHRQRVCDILLQCGEDGKDFEQPDWSFLSDENDD